MSAAPRAVGQTCPFLAVDGFAPALLLARRLRSRSPFQASGFARGLGLMARRPLARRPLPQVRALPDTSGLRHPVQIIRPQQHRSEKPCALTDCPDPEALPRGIAPADRSIQVSRPASCLPADHRPSIRTFSDRPACSLASLLRSPGDNVFQPVQNTGLPTAPFTVASSRSGRSLQPSNLRPTSLYSLGFSCL